LTRVWHDDAMTETADPTAAAPGGITLRRPQNPDEQRRFIRPLELAFAEFMGDAEWENERQVLEWDRVIAAFEGDEAVGCSGLYSFRMTVPGGAEVAAGGVTMVGVIPSHRRRGILTAMMRELLDDAESCGESLAILWASEGAIYQRFGFGMGVLSGEIDLERSTARFLRPVEPLGRIRLVERDEAVELFMPIYDVVRRTQPGALTRREVYWRQVFVNDADWMRGGAGPKYRAVLEIDGVARGYAVYRNKIDFDTRGPKSELRVLEVASPDPAVERALWRWLLDMDLVHRVIGIRQAVPHPLQLVLAEPRRLGLTVNDGLWVRILDVQAALEARTYAAAGRLVLDVRDTFRPDAAGRYLLETTEAGKGTFRATVSRSEDAPDITLDIADLGTAYLGTFRFADLARAGRIEERTAGAVARLDRLFPSANRAWTSTMF
jgi:predicted acetyltransferase